MTTCTLSEQAKKQVTKLCQDHSIYAVSLNLKGGGCAGFEYDWGMIKEPSDVEYGSYILKSIGGNLVIGPQAVEFFEGTEIDYKQSIVGSSFEIKNPNAQSACGCGVSVNFDLDSLS
jgi:iron-sulfur cluster assembly accessory protein